MMNGAITDPNAALFKSGAKSVLDGKVKYGKEYDTKEWKPENANANMEAAITALGKDKIDGVYSANDGMAGGIITALKAARASRRSRRSPARTPNSRACSASSPASSS